MAKRPKRGGYKKKSSGYVPKTLQRAKEATYQELERLTDEQIRRVMRTLEIQASDVQRQLEKQGISIPMRYPSADTKTITKRSDIIQQIQVRRSYIEAGKRSILSKSKTPEYPGVSRSVVQQATEMLFDAYEGNIEWFYVESAVVKVVNDGAVDLNDILSKASNILEQRHPEYSGMAVAKIQWTKV